jgi:hypothetical protein
MLYEKHNRMMNPKFTMTLLMIEFTSDFTVQIISNFGSKYEKVYRAYVHE